MWKRYLAVVITSALADAVYTGYVLTANRGWIILSLLLGSSIPFFNLLGSIYFLESHTRREQLYLTTAISIGMFIGSLATLLVLHQ